MFAAPLWLSKDLAWEREQPASDKASGTHRTFCCGCTEGPVLQAVGLRDGR